MGDFEFRKNSQTLKWVIVDPKRSKRPDVAREVKPTCPFCPGDENGEEELFRLGGEKGDSNWHIRVMKNKFPFAPIHELIIHSPDHHKNFGELPQSQVELILQTYRARFQKLQKEGDVYLFHNRGEQAGESLPHPHTQLVVVPPEVHLDIPPLVQEDDRIETNSFFLTCPSTSEWPDEVWVSPKRGGTMFGDITDDEIKDLAKVLNDLVLAVDGIYGHEFPFNHYIYPGRNWYLRFIPRVKTLGGFEVGTKIMVNTKDPAETLTFLKSQFSNPKSQNE